MLKDKQIILAVCGGIAVYKCIELARLFVKEGASVHVIMTDSAREFVTPLTFQTITGNPVHTELFNLISEREIGHISLADRADLFIIAPATANVIGKIANGIADDMLTTTVMATKAPVIVAPAMNCNMYSNPIYRKNEDTLRKFGYNFVDPVTGMLACGWEGEGKFQEPGVIVEESKRILSASDLDGVKVLVTAGPTVEPVDPVRFISNHSSGKMGYAIAKACWRRGAEVTLVSGPVALAQPYGIKVVKVTTAVEMRETVIKESTDSDIIIKAAAVADYRAEDVPENKIKKKSHELSIKLVKNPDILAELGLNRRKGEYIVGFAAETEYLKKHALEKLKSKNADMIVANDVSSSDSGFNTDNNRVHIYTADGDEKLLPLASKDQIADKILDEIVLKRAKE